jgi:hypothetical protein
MDSVRHQASSEHNYTKYFEVLLKTTEKYDILLKITHNMDEKGFMITMVIGESPASASRPRNNKTCTHTAMN